MTDEDEWRAQLLFNIEGVRMLHDHLEYAIKMWPGSPDRPAQEQEMLIHLRDQVFAMRMDYMVSRNQD